MDRGHTAPFLIVEPDPELAKQLTVKLGRHAPTVVAGSMAEAKILANEREEWSGVCTELRLPDGSGLALVDRMRKSQPELCALVLSALHDPTLLGDDAASGLTILSSKPPQGRTLSAFLVQSLGISRPVSSLPPLNQRTTPLPSVPPKEVDRKAYDARVQAVRELAKQRGLTDEETRIVGLTVEGRSPDETIDELGIEPKDWDTRIASILSKTEAHNMGQLALRLVKEAMTLGEDA